MDPLVVIGLVIALLLLLLLVGMPVAFALALAGVAGLALMKSIGVAIDTLGILPYAKSANYFLTVVPMFVLMGQLGFASGLSRDAYSVGHKWMGHLPGGVAIGTVAGCAIFGAACGSSMAEAAAMGRIAIPEMRRLGYSRELACGCVASAGLLAIMIPPSVGLVFYGVLTGESVGKMLVSGILPGILTAVNFSLLLFVMARVNPRMAPRRPRASWRERLLSLPAILPVGVVFIIVMGGIYGGVFTPTEAGALGAFGAFGILLAALFRADSSWGETKGAFLETAHTSAMIILLFIGAGIFSLFLGLAGVPRLFSELVVGSGLPPMGVLLLIALAYIPLGMFLDPMSIVVMTIPIVYPAIIALGFSGIWFGIILMKLIEISFITPPVGLNVFVVHGIVPDVPLEAIFRGVMPFLVVEILTVGILIAFPQIALWLPGMMR
jgi:tripartite ATP-independent transporter DctM subunit